MSLIILRESYYFQWNSSSMKLAKQLWLMKFKRSATQQLRIQKIIPSAKCFFHWRSLLQLKKLVVVGEYYTQYRRSLYDENNVTISLLQIHRIRQEKVLWICKFENIAAVYELNEVKRKNFNLLNRMQFRRM